MNTEEAKKIAEAIAIALVKWQQGFSIESIKDQCVKILTTYPPAPVEKEYRAGEWVPETDEFYCSVAGDGETFKFFWSDRKGDVYRLSQGNVFPTKATAEAAKKHAEFWREFDMADEGGSFEIYAHDEYDKIGFTETDWRYGCPKFQSKESARAWVESHGGEAYVSEMLTKGRVFRFKWGGG